MTDENLRKMYFDIVKGMSNQELSKWLCHCAQKHYCDDCKFYIESDDFCDCINVIMEEASTRLLKWSPNFNNEYSKEKFQ